MIANSTLGVDSTRTWTRVPTLLLHTSQMVGALCVDQTFGATADVWIANMLGDTFAGPGAVAFRTFSVGSARRGVAGVHLFWRAGDHLGYKRTAVEWIAGITLWTGTDGVMCHGGTSSIVTTGT